MAHRFLSFNSIISISPHKYAVIIITIVIIINICKCKRSNGSNEKFMWNDEQIETTEEPSAFILYYTVLYIHQFVCDQNVNFLCQMQNRLKILAFSLIFCLSTRGRVQANQQIKSPKQIKTGQALWQQQPIMGEWSRGICSSIEWIDLKLSNSNHIQ